MMKILFNTIWNTYRNSWKNLWSLRALWIVLADSGFYLALLLLSMGMTPVIAGIASGFQPGLSQDAAKVFVTEILITIIGLVIISWIVWTVSRAIVWQLLVRKRFTKKVWAKFFGVNLIWTAIMALPIYFLIKYALSILTPGVMPSKGLMGMHYALILVLIYFGYNVFYAFVKEQKVFAAYKVGLKRAVMDIAYQFPAYLALAVTIVAVGLLNPLIAKLPNTLGLAVSYLVLFGSLTWAKIYYYDVLEGGARKHKKKTRKTAKAKGSKKKS